MTAVSDIRRSALLRYREFLRSVSSSVLLSVPSPFFPWKSRGNKGRKGDDYGSMLALYSDLYSFSKDKTGYGYRLVTETVNTRSYGEQTVIREIVIESEEDYISFIGKEKEYMSFRSALETLRICFLKSGLSLSALDSWVKGNLDFLQEKKEENYYISLFSVLEWFLANPSSGLYIREIPLPVHTKFIEDNSKPILSLYSCLTGKDALTSLEDTFGLRRKEPLIRYRMTNGREETGVRCRDFITLAESEDIQDVENVFVIENEIVYLTFPLLTGMMCIYGGGFAVSRLRDSSWLKRKKLYYFGDEDEHGFEILALVRSFFPHTRSFLMDMTTYLDHREYAVRGKSASSVYDSFLTPEEMEVLSFLRNNPSSGRLEQERISIGYITKRLKEDVPSLPER